MTAKTILRDERTVSVENTSYRWAYLLLSYGLLVSTGYRAFVTHESSWDLLALVIAAGAMASLYQGGQRVLSRRWGLVTAGSVALALVLAATIVVLRR